MGYTVGIISPGDMGSGIGEKLVKNGARVVVALDARSERTKELAAAAGLEDVGSVERLVQEASHVLSVMVPSEAVGAAERVAQALQSTGAAPIYADLNAISPGTTKRVGEIVEEAGARYVDGGIIGGPPRGSVNPRIYLSGPNAPDLAVLEEHGLILPVIGDQVGQASGLKMCYASMTKGLQALGTELLVTARLLGLDEHLRKEMMSQPTGDSPVVVEVGAGDAAEGAPLDRRDGRDRADFRGSRADAEDAAGRGGHVPLDRDDRARPGDHRRTATRPATWTA